jgi:tyrosyl-tRNA synthetase
MKSDVASGSLHPREAKLRLARELAARFHTAQDAEAAIQGWQAVVRGEADKELLVLNTLSVPPDGARLASILKLAGLAASNTEANRKIVERAVRIDNQVVEDPQRILLPGFEGVLQVGKRSFARVLLQSEAD